MLKKLENILKSLIWKPYAFNKALIISDANFKREGGKIKEKIAKEKQEADDKLPWWRSGKIKGLEKQEKPINLDKISNKNDYITKGKK